MVRSKLDWAPALLLLVLVLLLFHHTAAAMVSIWIRSETFQHAFLVLPISIWLVWRRRTALAALPVRPTPWLLIPVAAVNFFWLLGSLGQVAAASQFALVTLVILCVPAMFGWAVTRLLVFPLFFLCFSVPFGEFAVPVLQEWTADMTVLALRLTGIPVYREGMQFVIPSGTWSVVAACSGIRYLIACFMVGVLYAYLNFRSLKRRLLFTLAALLVPVLANWIRAYTIVMIGHLTGSPMILGVEHTTYGWVLFGVVVMLLFVLAGRWAEEEAPTTALPSAAWTPARSGRSWGVAAGILALCVGVQAWAWHLDRSSELPPPRIELPAAPEGWRVDAERVSLDWPPEFANPSATAFRSYADADARVDLWVAYYRQQGESRKLVTSTHRVVSSEGLAWRSLRTGTRVAAADLPPFDTHLVSRGAAPTLQSTERFRVWQLYWVGGRWMVNPAQIKLRQVFDRLLGRGDDGAIVLLATPMNDAADATLEKFARVRLEAIAASMTLARESR
jgi:exosortase A